MDAVHDAIEATCDQRSLRSDSTGIIDLSPEPRAMIYDFYYGPVNPVLRFYIHDNPTQSGRRGSIPHSLGWTTSGLPDCSLRQVCKLFAQEAKSIWKEKTASLTIDYES